MKERPILFSGPMVRAILEGRKTQTRRVVKPKSEAFAWLEYDGFAPEFVAHPENSSLCPYGQAGDHLWVRETFVDGYPMDWDTGTINTAAPIKVWYRADNKLDQWNYCGDGKTGPVPWKPSIHMPRWASRITLEITGVRVERLQEISEEDAKAEGAPLAICGVSDSLTGPTHLKNHRTGFVRIWNEAYSERNHWGLNPWVWVLEFRRVGE